MRLRLHVAAAATALTSFLALSLSPVGAPAYAADTPAATSHAVRPSADSTLDGVDLGPNVYVFSPDMTTSDIQATVDSIADQQVGNQFGEQRYALLFEPGTYGTSSDPLVFQVGYYTDVMGLGQDPGDVTINGSIDVYNQCDQNRSCTALNNFWRSVSNLTIDVANKSGAGCSAGEFWATSQATSMRRVDVRSNGSNVTLSDYCSGPGYASGGFIADTATDARVVNASQQQYLVRNSRIGGWTNGVWNQVFVGTQGAPAEEFSGSSNNNYTTIAVAPQTKEKPYLYLDDDGHLQVFVPSAATATSGTTWSDTTSTPGRSVPINDFFVASPSSTVAEINHALAGGKNLLLTPGVYQVPSTIHVNREDAVVLGLGLPTLRSTAGNITMSARGVPGIDISDVLFDAGEQVSPTLLRLQYSKVADVDPARPTAVHDVYFRVGGPYVGRVASAFNVNTSHVILDNIWSWRADHGVDGSVGWTTNTATNGLRVNGADVTAYGLFVEHYQGDQVVWRGVGGQVFMFQNEMPYDPPSQAAWMRSKNFLGHAAFVVQPHAEGFRGYGMGSYSFFNQGVDIHATQAFTVPPGIDAHLHDVLTVFLDGAGGIDSVVDRTGAPVTSAEQGTPSEVTDY